MTFNLINREPYEYFNISESITWDDDDNANGTRPNSVTVILFKNGSQVSSQTVTAVNNWTYTFSYQPIDDGYGNTYIVQTSEVPG